MARCSSALNDLDHIAAKSTVPGVVPAAGNPISIKDIFCLAVGALMLAVEKLATLEKRPPSL